MRVPLNRIADNVHRPILAVIFFTAVVWLLNACSPQDVESLNTEPPQPDRHLNLLYWQAPSTLNPYLSGGTKDTEAASMVIEPLAHYNENGEIHPILVSEVPTIENGGIAEDLMSITWKLKSGVKWSDGSDFTAHDVVFTGEYCTDEQIGCNSAANFTDVAGFEALDDLTVVVRFSKAKPFPYGPFVGATVPILQKQQFLNCTGIRAPECTAENFGPIGTGPFKVLEFRANDVVSYVANENFREPGKPYFQTATLKGGGDAASAARAVLTTGEYDYAWNLQVEPEILEQMAEQGIGEIMTGFGSQVERLMINFTNADSALSLEERSVHMDGENPHPFLTDFNVRRALSLAIDRQMLVDAGYGPGGQVTCNVVPAPAAYVSAANEECRTQNISLANEILDQAGWVRGDDGVRAKDGVRLSILYQTSTNTVRQGTQALIKQMWAAIGVETELRNIDAGVFFGADPSSPDTLQKFYSDIEMYTNNFIGNDPEPYFASFTCDEITGPKTGWLGTNVSRACSQEFDELIAQLAATPEFTKRVEYSKQLNDIIVQNYWLIPLIHRATFSAKAVSVGGTRMNGWDSELWNVADWYRIEESSSVGSDSI